MCVEGAIHAVMICGGGDAGERCSLTIIAQGTPFPLRKANGGERLNVVPLSKTKMGDAVVDHRDRQNKPAVGRYFL